MNIKSRTISEGGMIPARHTCDGENVSPPLEWSGAPAETKSFALIGDDPDAPAGTWVHWVVYNMPPDIIKLDEGVKPEREFGNGMRQGSNDFQRIGYGGPCPPGGTHRYYFKLYAVDRILDLHPGATKARVIQALQGHILAQAELMGKYRRS